MRTRLRRGAARETRKIVVIYALFGSAWIFFSDTLVSGMIESRELIARLSVFKGLLFILITSAMLHQLIGRFGRRNAEMIEELAESEERFQTIYHNVNDAIFIHAQDGSILDVNQTMCTMYGYPREEALKLSVQDISFGRPPYSQAEAMVHLEKAAGGEVPVFEWLCRRKDGTLFWTEVNMRGAAIRGEPRVIVVVRDITARKESEETIRKNEEALKGMMEQMPTGVAWTGETGTFAYLNRCLIDWLGYTVEDVPTVEQLLVRAFPEASGGGTVREVWNRAIRTAREGGAVPPVEGTATCKDGSRRHLIVNIRLVHDRFLYIFTDLTRWEAMQSEILKTQKLESLSILAGGIAHDFNNILTGILGNLSFMGLLIDPSHPARKSLGHAEKASLRAAELAHQLLTFAKGGNPVKKAVPVKDLVKESLSLALRGSNSKAVVDLPEVIDCIEADEGQMNQVFNNVIINALQAMPGGGTLTVSGENVVLGEDSGLRLPPGRYVKISFADQGCGIPKEEVSRIFDPFYTTKAGGTGLGLASVHSIVGKHNGKVEVSSTIGAGTTFTFYLPACRHSPEGEAAPGCGADQVETPQGRILVMDDEETIRLLTRDILNHFGYEVVACATGEEAVYIYQEAVEEGSGFAAAIMDLTVPAGMGGKEAAKLILALDPDAALIVSSGYSNDPVMASHRDYGFQAAITKPYGWTEIREALRQLPQKS
ncbi:PAS domain S-box protein [Geomonas sp. Red32]|uniref:PAS domain-containing hybrid sensor histidine kinase/response regulator n=1 Tax=Geomonas sp. Red32 TaxID=2912856 RepID=UPI00202CF60E|nr:PAS domain S-box protein [Geomonas sp. Red32]MCM0082740.1 PAS domain S-box protein [Geomonas sp. Red32]